jgi:hypothetical protein
MDPIQLQAAAQVRILNAWGNQITDEQISNLVFINRVIVPQNNRIFSAYTYDEAKTQYLMLPYIYFAIDISVQYSVGENCFLNPITPKPVQCI